MLNKIKDKLIFQVFTIYLRYLIGCAFTFASIVKIKGQRFYSDLDSIKNSSINSIPHFFETLYQTGEYWVFLGLAQLLASFLLMTQRYARFGALVFFPIMLNIFFITLSYPEFLGTLVITSLMLLANIYLLIWDLGYVKVVLGIDKSYIEKNQDFTSYKIWEICGLLIFVFTVFLRGFISSVNDLFIWVSVSLLIGLVSLFLGIKKKKSQKLQGGFHR